MLTATGIGANVFRRGVAHFHLVRIILRFQRQPFMTIRSPDFNLPVQTKARGMAVLHSPLLNKGTAFTAAERRELGLSGLLPPEIGTLQRQVQRAYIQYEQLPDALSKNVYLTALHDRNDVLFFRLFAEHLREMIPIVNHLTVGLAIQHYPHECRRPRGLYLSIDHPEGMDEAFDNFGAAADDVDLILATDAEQILGIGDWGVGGIEVSIGKLAIYTAAGGVDPGRVMPVMLDVGTDREALLNDQLYIGNRHRRVRGAAYDAFIDAYVKRLTARFPHALIQWEDFAPGNTRRILARYKGTMRMFSDDMQGTGAITLAAAISAVRACGTRLRNQRVVIFGSGTAGIGIADQLRGAMVEDGLTDAEALERIWCLDRGGLLRAGVGEVADFQQPYARPVSDYGSWKQDNGSLDVGLAKVIGQVRPTMLIGASAVAGAFTKEVIEEMARYVDRPIIFVLSTPHSKAEANASDLVTWTEGRALIATGSPSSPVTHRGVTYVIGEISNAMLYPGLALGTIVARAARVSQEMLSAGASAVSSLVTVRQAGASLLPHVDDLRAVAATVAVAVVEAAVAGGLARAALHDIVQQVDDAMWQPEYRLIEAI